MRQRQPDMKRHKTRLRARADQRQQEHHGACERVRMMRAHRGEGIAAFGSGHQAERQQQRERAEGRHDEIDVSRAGIFRRAVVAITSAQDDSDMNSQATRNEKASSASTTRFMPAR